MLSLYSTLDNYVLSHNGAAIAVLWLTTAKKCSSCVHTGVTMSEH